MTLRHHADPIGDAERFLLVVGHEQRRDAELGLDPADLVAQREADLGVERRQRLVEQEHLGLHGERPGEGDALLLAARQLVWIAVGECGELDELEHLVDPVLALLARDLAGPQAEVDVERDVEVREQAVALEHHAHVPLVRRLVGDVDAVHRHRAGVGAFETGGDAQRRGLPAPAGPEEADQLAVLHREIEPFQRDRVAERLAGRGVGQ